MKIKGFDKDLKCRGMQFEVGKEYKIETDKEPELCTDTVFHYCDSLQKLHRYYSAEPKQNNRFCEIETFGREVSYDEKCGCSHIKIIREITGEELNNLRMLINGNSGLFNSGDCNSGDCNSGNRNSGNWNSGNRNSCDCNSGNSNSGDCNSGNRNSGDCNSGDCNSGNCNSGNRNSCDRNSGNRNSGNWNSGNRNSGDWNSGNCNSGDWNSGHWNSGNNNSGNRNSGDCNSGNNNSGNWNKSSRETGFFNTHQVKTINVFNKPCDIELWNSSIKPNFIYFDVVKFIEYKSMTDDEKYLHTEAKTRGGYLKKLDYKEAFQKSYNNLSEEERIEQTALLKALPNFNADVFFEISGIRLTTSS
jgi:hypothetical protein